MLAFAIAFSLTVLILVLNVKSPLELSSFPSILLLGTLLRLSLNIAAARRILLYGNEGASAAGNIIEAFGRFVVGGNIVSRAYYIFNLYSNKLYSYNKGC